MGNKLDLAPSNRQVTSEEGAAYAEESNLLFTEASARTGEGVPDAFIKIAKKLPRTEQQLASPRLAASGTDGRRIDLGRPGNPRGQGIGDGFKNSCCN